MEDRMIFKCAFLDNSHNSYYIFNFLRERKAQMCAANEIPLGYSHTPDHQEMHCAVHPCVVSKCNLCNDDIEPPESQQLLQCGGSPP